MFVRIESCIVYGTRIRYKVIEYRYEIDEQNTYTNYRFTLVLLYEISTTRTQS